jgi:hypothetical protein
MNNLLSSRSQEAIKMLLMDTKIREAVLEDPEDKTNYQHFKITENGNIVLGETSWWFWNNLIKCQRKLSFQDFVLRVFRALVGLASNKNKNIILKGLSEEIIEKAVLNKDYNWLIDRLFTVACYGVEQGFLSMTDATGHKVVEVENSQSDPIVKNVIVNVNGRKKTVPWVDSVGDIIADVEIGVTDLHMRNR